MDEKKNGKVWMLVDRPVRHRLNLYKALLSINESSVLDQSDAIMALLDKVGAPPVPTTADAQTEPVAQ